MQCCFCKRDEISIEAIFSPIIEMLEMKIHVLDQEINNKKQDFRNNNGFTSQNFDKIKKIDKNLLDIEIKYFKENYDVFIKLDENLILLKNYVNEHNPNIAEKDKLNSLIKSYLNEPTDDIFNPIIKDINDKKNDIIKDIKEIKNRIEFRVIKNNIEYFREFEKNFMIKTINKPKYYFEINKNINQDKYILCPYCSHLFDTNYMCKLINDEYLQNKIKEASDGRYDHIDKNYESL